MKRSLLAILFVLMARPLLASCTLEQLAITPSRPTNDDEITVVVAGGCSDHCIPRNPRVTTGTDTITIDLETVGGCILIPTRWGERVQVGQVPAGTYTVIVNRDGKEIGRQTLVVSDPPFTLRPSFGPENTSVLIDAPAGACPLAPCLIEVLFGGVDAKSIDVTPEGQIVAVAPRHAPGLVDVVVRNREIKEFVAKQAYLYPDPQADLTGEHERVLFPVVFYGPGAHGSDWVSENFLKNEGPIEVPTIPLLWGLDTPVLPIGAFPLPPGETLSIPGYPRDGGLFMLVPRGMESWLAYSSHIVDRSRRATDAGTEMRVVHERETAPSLSILKVPLTAESRQTLRIYDFDAVDGRRVSIEVRVEGRTTVFTTTATLTHRIVCITTPCYPEHPTYATINLDAIPELRGAGTADIRIRAASNEVPLWAFVSVTNNDTQHVTTYSPQ